MPVSLKIVVFIFLNFGDLVSLLSCPEIICFTFHLIVVARKLFLPLQRENKQNNLFSHRYLHRATVDDRTFFSYSTFPVPIQLLLSGGEAL